MKQREFIIQSCRSHYSSTFLFPMSITSLSHFLNRPKSYPLGGSDWSFANSNGSVFGGATVPGNIFIDLQGLGKIPPPLQGSNDVALRWIAYENWSYTKTFVLNGDFLAGATSVFSSLFSLSRIFFLLFLLLIVHVWRSLFCNAINWTPLSIFPSMASR